MLSRLPTEFRANRVRRRPAQFRPNARTFASFVAPASSGAVMWLTGRSFRFVNTLAKTFNNVRSCRRTHWKSPVWANRDNYGCGWTWRRMATLVDVSGENTVSTLDIKKFLIAQNISFAEGYTCYCIDCMMCRHSRGRTGSKKMTGGILHLNMTTGMFLCTKCRSSGVWHEFQDQVALAKEGAKSISAPPHSTPKAASWLPSEKDLQPVLAAYSDAKPLSSLHPDKLEGVLHKFEMQNLGLAVLDKYDVRIKQDESELLFPIYSFDDCLVGCYMMSVIENSVGVPARLSWVVPRSLSAALFGFKQLGNRYETLIIASTPADVLAVSQELDTPVVCLPQAKSLPLEVLPLLESCSKIILWLGNDMTSWDRSKILASKLNDRRCFSIRPDDSTPSPKEALRQNLSLAEILKTAHPVAHEAITTFSTLRQQVLAEFYHHEQLAGIKWKRYPLLTRILKGHRKGELTIMTGSTGSGKTTFISDYSLDLCMQGVRTLWGSFEIRNTRLAKMMLTQFAERSLEKCLDQYDDWANQFEKLPLFFMTYHGSQKTRSVLDAMRHAVYVHDIEHVLVDNLQFMLGVADDPRGGLDRYWLQDMVVSSFRQFASVHNCHVTLVIHPRKENLEILTNMSIFGGAKAIQEADNILILQNSQINAIKSRKYIQVTKNRFDGDLGIQPLCFNRETLSFQLPLKKRPDNGGKTSDDELTANISREIEFSDSESDSEEDR